MIQILLKPKPSVLDSADALAVDERYAAIQVQRIMTDNPVTIAPDAPVKEAALKMCRHKIHSIPVLEEGRLTGIITETNIFNAFLEIFGIDANGMRIELLVEQNRDHFYRMLGIFRQQGMDILAITVNSDFSREYQLVMIKMGG